MVICQKCGYDNELGRIFCHSCGTKLNLSEIKSVSQGGKSLARKKAGGIGKTIGRMINIAILVVVVSVISPTQARHVEPMPTAGQGGPVAATRRALAAATTGCPARTRCSATAAIRTAFVLPPVPRCHAARVRQPVPARSRGAAPSSSDPSPFGSPSTGSACPATSPPAMLAARPVLNA